ncbi:aspartate kinase [Natranaerobius thermophilus JW/NM-WN-LF]|nr:aspartate kinase [Natranaerobius thermophilus]
MEIYVEKYGGSSLATVDKIKNVAQRIVNQSRQNKGQVIVVSAMGDTTDNLIKLAHEITPQPKDREMDMLVSTGEQVSISLLAMAIDSLGHSVISLTGPQVGIKTTGTYKKAKILEVNSNRIISELKKGKTVIVAGFQGITEGNEITTLGRGGSDTTAVAIAAALDAVKCNICTDTDGVYSADPRIVPNAKKLSEISYDEMLEMAVLGAKVLHPRSVELARNYNITLEVRSSAKLEQGTIVKGVEDIYGRDVESKRYNS